MTLPDLKGHLIARHANLAAQLLEKRKTVILAEAEVIRARREADTVHGALQATEQALADVETALQAAGKALAPAAPGAGKA